MHRLRRALKLYPEEIGKTLQFAWLSFLWSFAASGSVTFFDGIFLEVVGASWLPRAYGFASITLMIVSGLLFKGLRSVSLEKLYLTIQTSVIGVYLTGFLLLQFVPENAFFWLFGLKVFATVSYASLSITYWSFIDQYYDLQDAKRIYTLVMAAIFFGAIASGITISYAAAKLGISGMLFCIMASLALGCYLTRRIGQKEMLVHDELEELPKANNYSLSSWAKQITSSVFALFLIFNNVLAQLLWNITEFNYLSNFSAEFALQPTYKLTAFLGTVKAWISAANVLFMLFGYSRLIHRIGLNRAVVIPYVLFFSLYVAWIAEPSFFIAVLGILAVEGALFTIEDNNFNLLLGIIPASVKRSLRIFIEAFAEPLAILVAAGLLTFKAQAIAIGFAVAALAVIGSLGLKQSYTWAIVDNLRQKALSFTKSAKERLTGLSKRDRRILAAQVYRGNLPPLFALETCIALENIEAIGVLLEGFPRFSEEEQRALLKALLKTPLAQDPALVSIFDRLAMTYSHPELQILLALCGRLKEEAALQLIDSPDVRLQAAGILTLNSAAHIEGLKETYALRSMAAFTLQKLLSSTDTRALSMGLFVQGYMEYESDLKHLIPYVHHDSIDVQLAACGSIERLIEPEHTEVAAALIRALKKESRSSVRLSLLQSIGKALHPTIARSLLLTAIRFRPVEKRSVIQILSNGRIESGLLLEVTASPSTDYRARLMAGRALAKLDIKELRHQLRPLIFPEIEQARTYFWHAYHFKQSSEPCRALLAECMEGSFHHQIDFIIQLLASAGSIDESELIAYSLRSHNQKTRSHGVETLEKTCDRKIFRLLEPLVNNRPAEEKVRRISDPGHSFEEVLSLLETSALLAPRLIAWHVRSKLKIGNWKAMALERPRSDDPLFTHFISELLEEEQHS